MRRAIAQRVPPILGTVLAVLAVWGFLTIASVRFRDATASARAFLDTYIFWFPAYSLSWVVVLILVSAAVLARKRVAWWLFTGLVVLALASVVAYALDSADPYAYLGAGFQTLVLVVMLIAYPEFPAKVRRGSFLIASSVFVIGIVGVFALAVALVHRFPGTLPPDDAEAWALLQAAGLGIAGENYFSGAPPAWVIFTISALAAVVIIGATLTLFRSQWATNALPGDDERLLRALIDRYATQDSLAYFATRRDKAVVFSPDGLAALTYRVEVGVCLASADPIGDPRSWDGAITAWLGLCRRYGWAPAAIGASEEGARAYDRHDLAILLLGDESILTCAEFSLRGPNRDGLRQSVGRARRAGVDVRLRRHAEIPPAELADVERLAGQWRDTDDERGFSMALGRLGDPADGACLLAEARMGDDLVAFLSFVPWGRSGASLDLMRRSPDAPNGTTDLLVAEVCRQGPDLGISRLSLNFAVFRSVFAEGARLGAGPLLQVWHRALLFMSRWWQLESLYRANDKYGPHWSPRYLAIADRRLTARIALAAGIVEGFVPWPGSGGGRRGASPPASLAPIDPAQLPPLPEPHAGLSRPGHVRVRLAKADALLRREVDPWPPARRPTHTAAAALAEPAPTPVSVAGRILTIRDLGGVGFLVVRDWTGDIQVVCEADRLGAGAWAQLKADLDLGDLVRVEGVRGRSRRGHESILADALTLDAKCLHPLPDKRHGLSDPEARVRQRYVDLAVRPRARDLARARSAVLRSLRTGLYERGYDEVETPILQRIHGGANARPFETHINAYDLDLYLRIAPELYLKRLCVGGMSRVFEIGRAFRNEGVDFSHNPEFTILEAYEAHGDYLTMMDLCRTLIQDAARAVHGACVVPDPDGHLVDISGQWPVVTLHDAVSKALLARGGRPVTPTSSEADLREACALAGVASRPGWDAGQLALELYEHLCEKQTGPPTFYTDFPTSVSPLTRSHRSVPGVTERWDLVAWGVELGTAYSELTDPLEQRRRLTDQSLKAADGDPEAMQLDEDFLVALEYGMPPTGGLGMGVDRVVMLVTGASIRETLPFPLARPHGS